MARNKNSPPPVLFHGSAVCRVPPIYPAQTTAPLVSQPTHAAGSWSKHVEWPCHFSGPAELAPNQGPWHLFLTRTPTWDRGSPRFSPTYSAIVSPLAGQPHSAQPAPRPGSTAPGRAAQTANSYGSHPSFLITFLLAHSTLHPRVSCWSLQCFPEYNVTKYTRTQFFMSSLHCNTQCAASQLCKDQASCLSSFKSASLLCTNAPPALAQAV